jgi:hypothetical protein
MNISALINRTRSSAGTVTMDGESNLGTLAQAATTLAQKATTLMSCEACGLTGGPFTPAEAAHLHAIHDRMFHGFSSAA